MRGACVGVGWGMVAAGTNLTHSDDAVSEFGAQDLGVL